LFLPHAFKWVGMKLQLQKVVMHMALLNGSIPSTL
jgi:hypothetical protein